MKLDEAIAWLTTEGRFDMEGHCCQTSSEAVNVLLDALRNGEICTFEEIEAVPKAFHDKCMQIEIAKRMKLERPKGKWIKPTGMMPPEHHGHYECSECGFWAMRDWAKPWKGVVLSKFCGGCGAEMEEDT